MVIGGIVVDDAIVVIEAVMLRWKKSIYHHQGYQQAMHEISRQL